MVLNPFPTDISLPADVHLIKEPISDIVYNPVRRKFYVSMERWSASKANSIAPVDTASGKVETATRVGNKPGTLALSEDNAFLYVGIDGESTIQRINLANQQIDQRIDLGTDAPTRGYKANEILVAPGHSDWLAVPVVSADGVRPYKVFLFINGVRQPNTPRALYSPQYLVFGGDSSQLYGYDSNSSTFFRYKVTDQGIDLLEENTNVLRGYPGDVQRL